MKLFRKRAGRPVPWWSPVRTCPRDGLPMDIWSAERGRCTDMVRVDAGNGNVYWTAALSGYTCVRDATHWMRVPRPAD